VIAAFDVEKKREVLHVHSSKKKLDFQERPIINIFGLLLPSPWSIGTSKCTQAFRGANDLWNQLTSQPVGSRDIRKKDNEYGDRKAERS
jgi:hypothetical protein